MAKNTLNGFAVALTLQNGCSQTIRVSKRKSFWLVTIKDAGGSYDRTFEKDWLVREYLMGRMETARDYRSF